MTSSSNLLSEIDTLVTEILKTMPTIGKQGSYSQYKESIKNVNNINKEQKENIIEEKNVKTTKKQKKKVDNIITPENIDKYIEKYINSHPEFIENYIVNNLKIDFKKIEDKRDNHFGLPRFCIALYLKNKLFAKSNFYISLPV